jgi:EF hand
MRKQKSTTLLQQLIPAVAIALVSASAMAQTTPAPAAPAAKPDKAMPAASSTAPTASQSNDALFKRIDTDGDGSLSKTELEKFDPEAAKSFDKYDGDKDGKLSLSEFDAMVKGLRGG